MDVSQTTHTTPLTFKPMTRANIRSLILEEIAAFNGGATTPVPLLPTAHWSQLW